ncbi:MAG: twin-arginine translocation signal domain-containing protein [Bacteroidetes bacterium]|nr:twin-arginine translocation signal domain-containing protein [Bacteroidota bacterium]
MQPKNHLSRRDFLKLSACGAALAAGCSDLGLDEPAPLFDGPEINEDEFISFNTRYYNEGIDPTTKLPFSAIKNGSPSAETDPLAIAYRLQQLVDEPLRVDEVDALLTQILTAQISDRPPRNYRNMIPRLSLANGTVTPATTRYSIVDNAVLAARVAMAAQRFNGTSTADKALTFLEKQKSGYNQALAQGQGFLPFDADASVFGLSPTHMDLIFGGYYASIAFVLSYAIGGTSEVPDTNAGRISWRSMIAEQRNYMGEHQASTTGVHTIQTPLAKNGSAFQFFHALLTVEREAIPQSLYNGLYNALYSYLDAAVFDRVPGIYSAGPHNGGFLRDNGLARLSARQRFQSTQETIVNIDALAIALKLFDEDSDERKTIRGWIALFATVAEATGTLGYFGAMDRDGNVTRDLHLRQNGAMILLKSDGPVLLDAFLKAQGKPSMREMMSDVELEWEDAPLNRIDDTLPLPIRSERLFTSR